jgi:FkbM family methyltransferase
MLIFLDVGAHVGQTVEEVVKPRYGFDQIYAFEPMPVQFRYLSDRFEDDARVEPRNFGLSDASGVVNLYGSNREMEASIYAEKNDADEHVVTECRMLEASEFIDTLPDDATIIMKLNCEGAEIPILNNLVNTGRIHRLHNVMIDFDIRKVAGQEHLEKATLKRFGAVGFSRFALCDNVMRGNTHQDRIATWLDTLGPIVLAERV